MIDAARRQTLGDLLRRSAARHPGKPAIACGEVHWTYGEFDRLCDDLAAGLRGVGVGKGDRVALLARKRTPSRPCAAVLTRAHEKLFAG